MASSKPLGGPIIDFSDTVLDTIISGLGLINIGGLAKGIARGASIYREKVDAVEGLYIGMGVTFEDSVWAVNDSAEPVIRSAQAVTMSKPTSYLGGKNGDVSRLAKRR